MTAFHQNSISAKLATMKSLALVLVFCACVSLSDSVCSVTPLKPGAKFCVDGYDNSRHPMGITWTNPRCLRCTCFPGKMRCCHMVPRVTNLSLGCIVKYDYKKCTFEVFNRTNPKIKCSYGTVEK
ncbi:beta-microseminoprotein-like [Cyprinus carpio]|uniref:Beta-microseminoprotein-like n=1 Tax=Cyprinus carpio TaxID=7962 RepID=A0A9Q9YEI2_CYPCA|nr:beta-microseminoprotein-like [Cyprinus carpio]